jgi:hypothetical protein
VFTDSIPLAWFVVPDQPVDAARTCPVSNKAPRRTACAWRRSDVVYGCPQNTFRGASVCANSVRVFRRALEERLLGGLQEQIMRPEAVEYVLARFEAELVKALDNLGGELEQMRRRKESLEREVANLANVVAQGDFSPALRAALVDRGQIDEIAAKLLESRPDSLRSKLRNIRAFVVFRMPNLRAVLNSDVAHVRSLNWQSTSRKSRARQAASLT